MLLKRMLVIVILIEGQLSFDGGLDDVAVDERVDERPLLLMILFGVYYSFVKCEMRNNDDVELHDKGWVWGEMMTRERASMVCK